MELVYSWLGDGAFTLLLRDVGTVLDLLQGDGPLGKLYTLSGEEGGPGCLLCCPAAAEPGHNQEENTESQGSEPATLPKKKHKVKWFSQGCNVWLHIQVRFLQAPREKRLKCRLNWIRRRSLSRVVIQGLTTH